MEQEMYFILLILRFAGIVVCVKKAKELNRSQGGWGFFGFASPLVAMVWIHCMKPNMVWDDQSKKENQ